MSGRDPFLPAPRDGWNNGQLLVYQGAVLRGTATILQGSNGQTDISVCTDSVYFLWQHGAYDSEISFYVLNDDGDTLLSVANAYGYSTGDTLAVAMNQCPTCPRVSGLHVASRTHNQLVLAWNNNAIASWLVEYGQAGFTPGSGTTLTVTTPAVTLTGLDSSHTYDVYLTSTCGN